MKPSLTIMTGPQGSGNHLFSKSFGQNKNIWVWPALQEKYWEGHDLEPFAKYWKNPKNLGDFNWAQSNFFITSISCPYFDNGTETIPNYYQFIKNASLYANVQIFIIGRDQNILEYQQTRVRDKSTTGMFLDLLPNIISNNRVIFASQELLYLYKLPYLQYLETQIGLSPTEITSDDKKLLKILETDANKKYSKYIEHNWLDEHIIAASTKKE